MALERRKEPGEPWGTVEASGGGLPSPWTDGGNGDVTAQVDDVNAVPLTIDGELGQVANFFAVRTSTGFVVLAVSPPGYVSIQLVDGNSFSVGDGVTDIFVADTGGVGFNGAAASKPTGVPVTAQGIHDALVSLGLITA